VLAAQQPVDTAAGQRLFAANCAVCHGFDGTGSTVPINLTRGEFKRGGSDEELFNTITKGIPGTEMPGSFLSPSEIKQVVEFVQALARSGGGPTGGGDASRGAALFRGKAGCAACHRAAEEGAHSETTQIGPNLYGIGDRRTVSELRSLILPIHRGLSEFAWQVTAVTKSGQRVVGTRLNEDIHSFQLRDANNNLISLLKRDLREFKVGRGDPLPAFRGDLAAGEVGDLAAYLATLRRGDAR
jgi:mono/diheme cytochrome c family protein